MYGYKLIFFVRLVSHGSAPELKWGLNGALEGTPCIPYGLRLVEVFMVWRVQPNFQIAGNSCSYKSCISS
jgi:hypothetical protein